MSKSLKERRLEEVRRQRRNRNILIGGITLVVLVGLGALIYGRFLRAIEGLEVYSNLSREHVTNVDIPDEGVPPVGGVHDPTPLTCGVYREPVPVANAVHSLEHGAIWIAYHPDVSDELVAELESYVDNYTLIAPYPGLQNEVVVTAWGYRLRFDGAPDERLDQFITRYKGQGPEPGASCRGVGSPVATS